MTNCCCTRRCPLITSTALVSIAVICSLVGCLGLSSDRGVLTATAWYAHLADNDLRLCPGPEPRLYPYKGNFDLHVNLQGWCRQEKTPNGQDLGPTLCFSFAEDVSDTECEAQAELPAELRSRLSSSFCNSREDYDVLAAMTILGCVFSFLFLVAVSLFQCSSALSLRMDAKLAAVIFGLFAWCFLVVSAALFVARSYPGIEDKHLSLDTRCGAVPVHMNIYYALGPGWFLMAFAFIFTFIAFVMTACTPLSVGSTHLHRDDAGRE